MTKTTFYKQFHFFFLLFCVEKYFVHFYFVYFALFFCPQFYRYHFSLLNLFIHLVNEFSGCLVYYIVTGKSRHIHTHTRTHTHTHTQHVHSITDYLSGQLGYKSVNSVHLFAFYSLHLMFSVRGAIHESDGRY